MRIIATARALLVNPKGEILLVRRSATDPRHAGKWDIPGGQLDPGESISDTVRREALEEIGYELRDPQLVYGISAARPEGTGTWLFFVERVAENIEVTLSHEHDDYKWVPFADLPSHSEFPVIRSMHEFLTTHHII